MKFLLSLLVFIGFSAAVNSQTLNYYYGNLHAHTAYSDGNKDYSVTAVSTPSASYAYAKLSQNFDFLGISEHNHYSSGNPGMKLQYYSQGLAQAAAANTGTFLCLYGMEWGTSSNTYFSGHVVVYGFTQLIGWETQSWGPNYDIYNDKIDYDGLFKKIKNNPNGFATLAHPESTDFSNLSNTSYNLAWDSAIVGSVFKNGPAFSTATTYDDFAGSGSDYYFYYYRKILSRGYHVGITYDQDNHYTNFGRSNAGRLVVMAPTLTETNFYYAMKNMHFYASDDWNCQIDFKINSSIMGDSTSGIVHPTINVMHTDLDGETPDSIKVWSGVEGSYVLPTITSLVKASNTLSFTDNTQVAGTNKYYFVEVVQADGDRIISSPIWYRLSNFAGIREESNNFTFLMAPNPVHTILYLSTDLKDDYTVEIVDVSGKLIYSETFNIPNSKISTEQFASGFYTVKISNGKFMQTKKLVIE
jgi:hypothetical protein